MPICDCNIASIERECNKPVAGLKPLWYLTCEDEVNTIGAATDHSVATITMRAAASPITKGYFRKWNPSRKDSDFKSTQDPETGQWKTEFTCYIPKQTSAKAVILNRLGEDNNIVVLTDMNGKLRIVGELGNPANITVEETVNPKNGYTVKGTWESGLSPYFFTGTPDVTP
jgi:hypothetical protein